MIFRDLFYFEYKGPRMTLRGPFKFGEPLLTLRGPFDFEGALFEGALFEGPFDVYIFIFGGP